MMNLINFSSKIYNPKFILTLKIRGGLENNCMIEVCGEAGTGKTNFALLTMIRAALPKKFGGQDTDVLFITTVQKFSQKRFDQLLKNFKFTKKEKQDLFSKFHIEHMEPEDFEKFLSTIDNFIVSNKIGMVIIDSITGLSDVQFIKENNEVDFLNRAQFFRRIIPIFKEVVFKYELFFMVTNNMSSNIVTGKSVPNLGPIWENGINTRILLMRYGEKERIIQINFSNFLEKKQAKFVINDEGIYLNNEE